MRFEATNENVKKDERGEMKLGTPCSGEMFSSCWPWSALVEGVNNGSGSFWDSKRPAGRGMPCTVPDFLYSAQPEPETIMNVRIANEHRARTHR